jgi:uncharacterized membrane protein YbhN (UPF0104 family)
MTRQPTSSRNEEADAMADSRLWRGHPLIRAVGLVCVGAVAVAVLHGRMPDPHVVLEALRRADLRWLALAAVAQVVSIEMFARQQSSLLRGFGVSLSAGRSRTITYARTAISVIMPAGSVVSAGFAFAQWRARGATRGVAAAVTVLSGIASFVGLAGLYLIGLAAAVAVHPGALAAPSLSGLAAGAGCLGVSVVLLGLVSWARRTGQPDGTAKPVAARPCARSATWARSVAGLRSSAVQTWRAAPAVPRRYAVAAVTFAAVNWLTDLACLVVTARALHLRLGPVPVAGVYLAAQIVRQVPLTPGGIGLIEAGLLAGMVAAGVANADASAVVLAYRLLSCWVLVPIGAAAWATLRYLGRPRPAELGRPGCSGPPPAARVNRPAPAAEPACQA